MQQAMFHTWLTVLQRVTLQSHSSGPLVKAAAGSGSHDGREERASPCYHLNQVLTFCRGTEGAGARAAEEKGKGTLGASSSLAQGPSANVAAGTMQSLAGVVHLITSCRDDSGRGQGLRSGPTGCSCAVYGPHHHPCLQKQQQKQRLCFQPIYTPTTRSLQGWWRWQRGQGPRWQRGQGPRWKGWWWPRRWWRQHHGS